MTSSAISPGPLCDVAPPLAAKLEYAILSVLVHHRAEIESTLPTWYLSLKLAFPALSDRLQVKNVFKHLWKTGLIALKSPWIGDFTIDSGDSDLDFLSLGEFTVALTTLGVVRWDTIRRYPATKTETLAARATCPERLALSNKVSEAEIAVSEAKASVDAAKARNIQNLELLHAALAYRRNIGRDAVRALDEHVKTHGCMVRGNVSRAAGR